MSKTFHEDHAMNSITGDTSNALSAAQEGAPGLVGELISIVNALNRELFTGSLPACDVILNRRARTFGSVRIYSLDGILFGAPQISMNSALMSIRTLRSTFATLTSLMCEVNAFLDGRTNYRLRNKKAAEAMLRIGLVSSSTGRPGGKKTGYNISFYILKGGAFDRTFDRLSKSDKWITWSDLSTCTPPPHYKDFEVLTFSADGASDAEEQSLTDRATALGIPPILLASPTKSSHVCLSLPAKSTKGTFVCPGCGLRCWAKRSSTNIHCAGCDRPLELQ